jgi:hypothetical protein
VRQGVEDEASGEGAEHLDTEFVVAKRGQVVLTNLDCPATLGGGVPQEQLELLSKRASLGKLDRVDGGNRERVVGWEGRGGRSRPVRPDRTDNVQGRVT